MPKAANRSCFPFAFQTHCWLRFCGGVFLALAWLALSAAQAQTTNFALGTDALVVGPSAGSDSVVLVVIPPTGSWTNTANAAWLHLSPANQSGTGSTNVVFSYDANSGATRYGILTIGDQTLGVTQAGSAYVAAEPVTTLVSSALYSPEGVAVDGAGNVYIADTENNAIKEWTVANSNVITLVSSNLSGPRGVAVDDGGNVYVADTADNAIKEWTAVNSNVITLVSSNLSGPCGVAVDHGGNVYIADTADNAIKEWTAANSNVTTLVSSNLDGPYGVAVDSAGNVYIADAGHRAIKEWTAATSNVITLVSSALNQPYAVAVDGAGNVYIVINNTNGIQEWTAANGTVATLVPSVFPYPYGGVAVDGAGNVYIADPYNNAIKELPHAFVDPSDRLESLATGNDALPAVLPATENLLGPFAPGSNQPWLTISGITNDVINFAFTATTSNRTGYLTVLGQTIPVTQGGPTYLLGTTTLLEGPSAGSDSVVLAVIPAMGAWTNTANATWLHLSSTNQIGTGSTNVVFSYDANPSPTRFGTLTIGDQTLTVTQAGSTYVAARPLTTLVSSNQNTPLNEPFGVAVDGAGNVYVANISNIPEWKPASDTVSYLVPSGLHVPCGVAVDSVGNLYIADTFASALKMWTAANSNLTTLVPAYNPNAPFNENLNAPYGVAVDGAGNVYIADTFDRAIKKWTAANSNVTTLVAGLVNPYGVALDSAGNVYIAEASGEGFGSVVQEWTAANGIVTTLVAYPEVYAPYGVAVDGVGNVYIADLVNNAIKKWTAANNTLTTLVSSGLNSPVGVAVDGAGNVYIADFGHNAIEELPYAFVDPTPRLESLSAGNDALPPVLPATENLLPPFAPTSDQSWLTITGITNGVVSFSFTADTGPARTANITVLGQTIPITQGLIGTPPILIGAQMLGNGVLQFAFTNNPSGAFTVLSTTNLSLPLSNWTVVGTATNFASGQFQFTSAPTTNDAQCFYTVRSP